MYYDEWHGEFILNAWEPKFRVPAIGERLAGGSTWHKAVANFTTYPILLKSGYDTDANGRANDIVCPPMATIRKLSSGGPRDFATYIIEPLQEIEGAFIFEANFRGVLSQ